MKKQIRSHPPEILLKLVGFLLLGLAFQTFWLGWLVLPGIALVYKQFLNWKQPNFAKHMWYGGLLFMALVWDWLLVIKPDSWAPIDGPFAFLLVIFIWALVVIITSAPLYAVARFWVFLNKRVSFKPFAKASLFAALWVLYEYSRSLFFAFCMLGEGTTVAPHWNFGTIGIALLMFPPMLPLASTIGMYGLSLVGIFTAILAIPNKKKISASNKYATLALILLIVVGYGLHHLYRQPSQTSLNVAILNSETTVIEYDSYGDASQENDLIVLPEYSYVFEENLSGSELRAAFVDEYARNDDSIIVTSTTAESNNGVLNRLTHYSADGSIALEQDKTFLIPGGEYLAYWFEPLYGGFSPSSLLEYNVTRKVIAGTEPEKPLYSELGTIGSFACSGVISPDLYRNMSAQGAQILTNSASLAIFNKSHVYHEQTKGFALFHAAANQKPFVQATKEGKALIIDENGRLLQESAIAENVLYEDPIQLSNSKTVYTRIGDVGLYIAILIVISTTVLAHNPNISKRNNLKTKH